MLASIDADHPVARVDERPHLRVPHPQVQGTAVEEDDWSTAAFVLVVQPTPVTSSLLI